MSTTASTTTVTTTAGVVRGRAGESARQSARQSTGQTDQAGHPPVSWRGIPYAAAPVGPLRFHPPQPPAPWRGERAAVAAAGAATQAPSLTAPRAALGSAVGEDCLYLNVTSPAADRGGRAVLVWVHGGAFVTGSGALYDGAALAGRGDIVVVSVNYRLGVFGFADLSEATGTDVPSNLGLRDVIAALEWVRDNIAAFGGDPSRVTVAGESAGSVIVSLLTCAPAARGLFHAAICSSGSYSLVHGDGVRAQVAERYARALGAGPGRSVDIRRLPAAQLLAAQGEVDAAMHATTAAAPWFDGDVVPASLAAAQAAVRPDLPLLAGSNRDEMLLFLRLRSDILLTRREEIAARLRDALGAERAAAVLATYPTTRAGGLQLSTDLNFAMPTAHVAERHAAAGGATFTYRFDAATPWLGACHAAELAYLWDFRGPTALALRGPLTPRRRALAVRMQQHWIDFVRAGHPGPRWPAYDVTTRSTLLFDTAGDRVVADPAGARRRAWAGADVMPHP